MASVVIDHAGGGDYLTFSAFRTGEGRDLTGEGPFTVYVTAGVYNESIDMQEFTETADDYLDFVPYDASHHHNGVSREFGGTGIQIRSTGSFGLRNRQPFSRWTGFEFTVTGGFPAFATAGTFDASSDIYMTDIILSCTATAFNSASLINPTSANCNIKWSNVLSICGGLRGSDFRNAGIQIIDHFREYGTYDYGVRLNGNCTITNSDVMGFTTACFYDAGGAVGNNNASSDTTATTIFTGTNYANLVPDDEYVTPSADPSLADFTLETGSTLESAGDDGLDIGPMWGAASDISGTGSGALSQITGISSGSVVDFGSAIGVLSPVDGSAVGDIAVEGVSAGNLASVEGSSQGGLQSIGGAQGELSPITGSALGGAGVFGAVAGDLQAVTGNAVGEIIPAPGNEIVVYSGVDPNPSFESLYKASLNDPVIGSIDADLGDKWEVQTTSGVTYNSQSIVFVDPPVTHLDIPYRMWDDSASSWTLWSTVSWAVKPTLSGAQLTTTGSTTQHGEVSTTVGTGTVFWYWSESPTAPSVADLKAGTGAAFSTSTSVTATGVQSADAVGLTPGVVYYLHVLHMSIVDSDIATSSGVATDSADVSGTASGLLSTVFALGSGDIENAGTGAGSLSAVTSFSEGNLEHEGAGAGSLQAIEGSAVGATGNVGVAVGALAVVSGSALGALENQGAGNGMLSAISGSSVGAISIVGGGNGALSSVTGEAYGAGAVFGAGVGVLSVVGGAAAGETLIQGSVVGVLSTVNGAGAGNLYLNGSGVGNLQSVFGAAYSPGTVGGSAQGYLQMVTGLGDGGLELNGAAVGYLQAIYGRSSNLLTSGSIIGTVNVTKIIGYA